MKNMKSQKKAKSKKPTFEHKIVSGVGLENVGESVKRHLSEEGGETVVFYAGNCSGDEFIVFDDIGGFFVVVVCVSDLRVVGEIVEDLEKCAKLGCSNIPHWKKEDFRDLAEPLRVWLAKQAFPDKKQQGFKPDHTYEVTIGHPLNQLDTLDVEHHKVTATSLLEAAEMAENINYRKTTKFDGKVLPRVICKITTVKL